jgi:hypothetical protein
MEDVLPAFLRRLWNRAMDAIVRLAEVLFG